MGLTVVDRNSKQKFKTLAHQVIADDKMKETIAEEMRILYVAMTRARERLFITASKKCNQCAAIVDRCGKGVNTEQLSSVRCHFDWMLYGLGKHKELAELFKENAAEVSSALFTAGLYSSDEMDTAARQVLYNNITAKKTGADVNVKDVYQKVIAALAWQYPAASDTQRQAKSSVSALTHRDDEYAQSDYSAAFERIPGSGDSSNAMLVGSATHLLLQKIEPDCSGNAGYIESVRAGLVKDGLVEKNVAAKINIADVETFFASRLGTLAKDNRTYREWPFTMLVDDMIVQGIVDYIIETPDGLVVVDFKTDSVTAAQTAPRAEKYAQQLKYYGDAAEKILNKKVKGKYVYFLKAQIEVEV
jgi:ATP-dependent helicase/nuclease subunit A